MTFCVISVGPSPIQLEGRLSESAHHECQLVRRSQNHRRSHHVSFLQPVEVLPGEPCLHGPGPKIAIETRLL